MKPLLLHLGGWTLYLFLTCMYNRPAGYQMDLQTGILLVGLIMPVFYSLSALISRFRRQRRWPLGLGMLAIHYLLTLLYVYLAVYRVLPAFGVVVFRSESSVSWMKLHEGISGDYLRICCYALLVQLITNWSRMQTARSRAEGKFRQLSTDFLGFQINQHFINNTLNVLMLRSIKKETPLESGLLERFAELYAYSQQHMLSGRGLVRLTREIQALQEFVRMVELKYSKRKVIVLQVQGNLERHRIPPLCLLTFAENILKYGELSERCPATLHLESHDLGYTFVARNKIRRISPLAGANYKGGVGLTNIRQRFNALLPGKFELQTVRDEAYFTVHLSVNYIEHGNKNCLNHGHR